MSRGSLIAPLEAQRGNLLGDETHEKDDDAQEDEQHGRIRHVRLRDDRPDRVYAANRKRREAEGKEHAHWAEDRDDLQQNHEKLHAVRTEPDLRLAVTDTGVDWLEPDAVTRLDERQRRRRRCGEAIRQEVQEFKQVLAPGRAK